MNLGYRDADTLLNTLIAARECCEDWGSESVLRRYERRRRPDNLLMQAGMDAFYLTFSNTLRGYSRCVTGTDGGTTCNTAEKLALKYALGV